MGHQFLIPHQALLSCILRRAKSDGIDSEQDGEYAYQAPGVANANPVRITTRPDYFDEHSDSLELWSPGSHAAK
jgi:hypothetical protein